MTDAELWTGLDEDEEWEELIPSRFKKVAHSAPETTRDARGESWYD